MKIYVTGVAGMIGSNLAKRLIAEGYEVVGIDNFWRGKAENIASLQEGFTFIEEDLSGPNLTCFDGLAEEDVVVHLADIVAGIGYVFDNEWAVFQQNLKINTSVASAVSEKQPSKLIYVGTACSYPQTLQRSVTESMLCEAHKFPADPESGYGWSKLIGEIEYKLLCQGNQTSFLTLDLHNVYGWPCEFDGPTAQVIPALINRAIEGGEELSVWGDGSQGRAFVHVDDVVEALLSGIRYNGDKGTIMIGPSECTTIGEVASIIVEDSRVSANTVSFDTSKPTGDVGRFADYKLAREELNWNPSVEIADGISDLIGKICDAKGGNA